MRVVIASFQDSGCADAFTQGVSVLVLGVVDGGSTSSATVAAYGEPHDGHSLVAAWVPDDLETEVIGLALREEGVLHPPAHGAVPSLPQPRGGVPGRVRMP